MGGRPRNTPDVIWSKIDRRTAKECWPWIGSVNKGKRNKEPYGRLEINGKGYYAHRVVFSLCNPGLIDLNAPDDPHEPKFVLHECDNTLCCNPRHLYLGDHDDNMRDKVIRGRAKIWGSSVLSPRAKLNTDQVRRIRKIHAEGLSISEICAEYKLSRSCIDHVVRRWHYADID